MICPKCNQDTLIEENRLVVCSNCGFMQPIKEYQAAKRLEERFQAGDGFREGEEIRAKPSFKLGNYLNIRTLAYVALAITVFLIVILI